MLTINEEVCLLLRQEEEDPMCRGDEEKKIDESRERTIWETMTPEAWHNSVAKEGSIFADTYRVTRMQIEKEVVEGNYDIVIEVGSGTGDVIGELGVNVPKFGLDINPDFVDFCKRTHPKATFLVKDAVNLADWWKNEGYDKIYSKPLVTCVNNTLNIMPEEIRGTVVSQMLQVAGSKGRCLVTYWNGHYFSHALMNYYKANEELCGSFNVAQDVDWNQSLLVTPTGYSTQWMKPTEVQSLMRKYVVDVPTVIVSDEPSLVGTDHVNSGSHLAIFLWFSEGATSRAKSYYDSDDAQKFYGNIWGQETIHIGRYDLLSVEDKANLSKHEQISKAQELHEVEFVKLIQSKFADVGTKIRIVDFGCGYGGLLRRLYKHGLIWSATGCDIASKMCEQARRLNAEQGCGNEITILEESYLDVSVADESADLVISMDALLHVGPDRQPRAIQEASRILRPGGWMIFTDIMEKEVVDAKEMQPIYDRIHLSKLGTVSNYREALTSAGFSNFSFIEHSPNVASHYGTIREVLIEKGGAMGISKDYCNKMEYGLKTWRDLSPKNIEWGFVLAQKTQKA